MSANLPAVDQPAIEGLEEQSRFVRGLLFAMMFSLPLWGGIILAVRLLI